MIKSNAKIKTIKLLNVLGQHILIQNENLDTAFVDLSSCHLGTYLLVIENEFGTTTKKVIKN